jgi:hypothetical protein
MGLGDFFMCNGLIRTRINENENYTLFVKSIYEDSVRQMYSDLSNMNFIVANTINEIIDTLHRIFKSGDSHICIGYNRPNFGKPVTTEEWFYFQHNIDIENKWNKFKAVRNKDRELDFFNKFNVKEDYIFVHDDNEDTHPEHRGPKTIDDSLLPSNIRIIRVTPNMTNNIFDYCLLIENAKEVHCIESCFAYMTDLLNLNGLYIHEYPESPSKNDGLNDRNDKLADWKNLIKKYK